MRKTAVRRSSRLLTQRPAKKTWLPRRSGGRNSYRYNRLRGGTGRSWLKIFLGVLGLLALGGLCLGLVLGYHQLLTSSWFSIKDINNIQIEGNRRLTREILLRQTHLGANTSLLAIRPVQVEQALLAHPWIARAELTRKWPHRILIRITERDPVALVQIGEELYYVDRHGVLFKPLSPGDPHNFPVLTGLKPEHFLQAEGPLPEVTAQAFHLLEVLKKAAPPLNLENVSEVHADLEQGFTIYANGLKAALDLGFKDYSEKLQKFAHLWPVLTQKGYVPRIGRINLNYPQRVLVTVKGTEENNNP
jgi:cell division protein FtsQ